MDVGWGYVFRISIVDYKIIKPAVKATENNSLALIWNIMLKYIYMNIEGAEWFTYDDVYDTGKST